MDLPGVTVSDVDFHPAKVVVTVKLSSRKLRCAVCGFTTSARYDTRPVSSSWQHLDLGRWRLEVRADLRRIDCPTHGARTEGVPFARGGSRFTRDFEDLVAWLATTMDKTALCRLVRIDWDTTGRIIERVMATGLDPNRLDNLFVCGADEVSWRKGHSYLTLVSNNDTGIRLGRRGQGHVHPGLLLRRAGRRAVRSDHGDVDGHGPFLREVGPEGGSPGQRGDLLRSLPRGPGRD
jgi:transposase